VGPDSSVLLLNNGIGGFTAAGQRFGAGPAAAALVDVNHNQRLDVASLGVVDPYTIPSGEAASLGLAVLLRWYPGGLSRLPPPLLPFRGPRPRTQPVRWCLLLLADRVRWVDAGMVVAAVQLIGRSGALNQHGARACAAAVVDAGAHPIMCRVVDAGGGSRSQVGGLRSTVFGPMAWEAWT
jgi:hypothetical protein